MNFRWLALGIGEDRAEIFRQDLGESSGPDAFARTTILIKQYSKQSAELDQVWLFNETAGTTNLIWRRPPAGWASSAPE